MEASYSFYNCVIIKIPILLFSQKDNTEISSLSAILVIGFYNSCAISPQTHKCQALHMELISCLFTGWGRGGLQRWSFQQDFFPLCVFWRNQGWTRNSFSWASTQICLQWNQQTLNCVGFSVLAAYVRSQKQSSIWDRENGGRMAATASGVPCGARCSRNLETADF